MTKIELQKEILEKVKPGTKPSDIKRLKRSKSDSDIANVPAPLSVPLNRSKSNEPFQDEKYPYTTLISQSQRIEELEKETETKTTTISLLRKKITELEKTSNPVELSELDTALFARHKNLKDWFKQFQQTKQLDKELAENVNEASEELTKQDETISNLRSELRKLKQTNSSLEKDLELAQRLAHSRKTPYGVQKNSGELFNKGSRLPIPNTNWIYLELTLYSLFTVLFVYWMIK